MNDARESFNRLLSVEIALNETLEWLRSLHPAQSRVVRINRLTGALHMLQTDIAIAAQRLCTCPAGDGAHLNTCSAYRRAILTPEAAAAAAVTVRGVDTRSEVACGDCRCRTSNETGYCDDCERARDM